MVRKNGGGVGMFSFPKAYVLNDLQFQKFWEDYFEVELMRMFEELDEQEKEELLDNTRMFDKWIKTSVIELFNSFIRKAKKAEGVSSLIVFVDGRCHDILAGFLFYDLCLDLGLILLTTQKIRKKFGRGYKGFKESRFRKI
jgi:hypothetical protein